MGQYVPDGRLNKTIQDFVEYRKKIKKPMTDHAVELMIGKLTEMSGDASVQIKILNQSIVNGWTGIFPLKEKKGTSTGKPPAPNRFHNFEQRDTDYDAMVQQQAMEWLREGEGHD